MPCEEMSKFICETKTMQKNSGSSLLNATDQYKELRNAVRELCAEFPLEYFRKIDEQRAYPEEFVAALTKAGWLAGLIPEEYGGSGLGLTEASVIMEEINRSG